ncbi:Methyltransferase domain [Rubrobacter radiotolerans]|uniref:site-specific DNA-methyltransferase (adenine-specific) n=1 Tax=Rubrobacter radiotolerans TaxID=42256 RepID=A0A023X3I5_RUBRA|nr:DNA methyltransferase [Rubrobacter radiotolerans]AHY46604.1 Methyltransferase domain [Rubrobacter radiotolerans]MDX5894011.1 type IIL restriction-modification enzyme MmeI [Rubrobacter radiotolerans]SMC04964.1 Type II restriction/modification system, DNA methylase subunit YeeA [Rubrobacter radiotolerans DSM 5868]
MGFVGISAQEFVERWEGTTLSERASYQSHFNDLCDMLGEPRPTDVDRSGSEYTFEKRVEKASGGVGFADVWRRGRFAVEYKRPGRNLQSAYGQLAGYREALENPPVLIATDISRYLIRANFTAEAPKTFEFTNRDLLRPKHRETLRLAFSEPEALKGISTPESITREAAESFARLADGLRERGVEPRVAAHFLNRVLFCLFAEDVRLLPAGLFTEVIERGAKRPETFNRNIGDLFAAMAGGGEFALRDIRRFNGGLFDADEAPQVDLTAGEIKVLAAAARLDWREVEPTIFGTLFERSLDPAQRARLGAHYTSPEDIAAVVEPVLMEPLRREWEVVRERAEAEEKKALDAPFRRARNIRERAEREVLDFAGRLAGVKVLDPACGSGNFLYLALRSLLDLEKEVLDFASKVGPERTSRFPEVGPEQFFGIETSPYAHELAQVVVWIGYIQWLEATGYGNNRDPILGPMTNISWTDAVLSRDENGVPQEPDWPEADVIIGNPPFLGGKRLRAELEDGYVDDLFSVYGGRVPREADLVTYWFEKARSLVARGEVKRVGFIATNSVRGGKNREVLKRIKETSDIFFAESDREWILDGAAVRVSMVGFDDGTQQERVLDGLPVERINSDLTGSLDLTEAARLPENADLAFMGDTKGGPFDLPPDVARKMLDAAGNPNGRPNSDVVRPWVNGLDITRRPRGYYIVDFGVDMPEEEAALYGAPFEYVNEHVRPMRAGNKRKTYRDLWWIHMEPRPAMRRALKGLERFIGTPTVAKHRLFVWRDNQSLADHQIIAVARDDDYFFGVLHSRAHEVWSLRMGTFLGKGNDPRYTPTTCFETFPFPWPPGEEPVGDARVGAVAEAARRLDELRRNWLEPAGATAAELRKRTLTNLYNERPTWLENAHAALDRAVFAAYGWSEGMGDGDVLAALLALNLERAGGRT